MSVQNVDKSSMQKNTYMTEKINHKNSFLKEDWWLSCSSRHVLIWQEETTKHQRKYVNQLSNQFVDKYFYILVKMPTKNVFNLSKQ